MYPHPEISEYIVTLIDGKKIKKPISALGWLEHFLSENGTLPIRRILFRFHSTVYHPYYYPYSHHNIVLEKGASPFPPTFIFRFYHYYNTHNQRIDIPVEQQYYDYIAIIQLLREHPILFYYLYSWLLHPFPL